MWSIFMTQWNSKRILKACRQIKTVYLAVIAIATVGCIVLWFRLNTNSPVGFLPLSSFVPLHTKPLQPPSRLLPYNYWDHRSRHPENYNHISCSQFPQKEDIHYAAAAWQHLAIENGSIYLYGAYLDDRFDEPLVRVLVFCDLVPVPQLMCQLWYENQNAPITVPVTMEYAWRSEWGGPKDRVNEPYILTCRARRHPPAREQTPAAASLVREGYLCGTPTNVLNIQGTPARDKPSSMEKTSNATGIKISVCLKWLHFHNDVSAALVEWIEMVKVLGADKLFVFILKVHPNTRLVLDHYAATGFADVTEYSHTPQLRSMYPPSDQNFHDLRRELLPLNDCLYRSVNKYHWMAPLDSDEIIIPRRSDTWQQLIAEETNDMQNVDALNFLNFFFLDPAQQDLAAPSYIRILGHLWTTKEPSPNGGNVKSFHNTSSVVAMHNHYPISCSRYCNNHDVNTTIARLHHYRSVCAYDNQDCSALHDNVKDNTTNKWRYVIKEVDRVLEILGIKPVV